MTTDDRANPVVFNTVTVDRMQTWATGLGLGSSQGEERDTSGITFEGFGKILQGYGNKSERGDML